MFRRSYFETEFDRDKGALRTDHGTTESSRPSNSTN